MADPIKRLNYFDGAFLQVADFSTEQAYHMGMRRLHNTLFHAWGVAQGLTVAFKPGTSTASVSAGTALDSTGRELVLVGNAPPADVSSFKGQTVFLTITYQEQTTDPSSDLGAAGNTRTTEAPKIDVVAAPADPSINLVLARLTVGPDGNIASSDIGVAPNMRRSTGAGGADIVAHSVALTDANNPPTTWPGLAAGATLSTLQLTGNLSAAGDLTVGGPLNCPQSGVASSGPLAVNHYGGISQHMLFLSSADDTGGSALTYNAHRQPPPTLTPWAAADPTRSQVIVHMDDTQGYAYFEIMMNAVTGGAFGWVERFSINGDTGDTRMAVYGGSVLVALDVFARGVKLASDIRLKEEIRAIPDALAKVSQLRGVSYRRVGAIGTERDIGVIAQEVEPVLPELVSTSSEGVKAVDYARLTAVLVEAMKELDSDVSTLEDGLTAIEQEELNG